MRSLFLASLLVLTACNHSHSAGLNEPDEYTGCATDENWETFDDNEPLAVVANDSAPVITAPTAGAIASADRPTFSWNQNTTDTGAAEGDVPHDGPGCSACCPQWNTGALTTLHLPAISGNVYDLQFSIDGEIDHRVLTTIQRWQPTEAKWAAWKGKTVSLKIFRMTVLKNDLRPGTGGPFVAATPFVFSVSP